MYEKLMQNHHHLQPTFANGLTNHLPMVSYALYKLGADADRLVNYADHYLMANAVEPAARATEAIVDINSYLGKRQFFSELKAYFQHAVEQYGAAQVIGEHIDRLIVGSGGDAFHGLIRLAYAIESDITSEIAAGLAYINSKAPEITMYRNFADQFTILSLTP